MRLLKLNSFINLTTSISWDIKSNESHFFTDSGRIVRPVFYLKTDDEGNKYNELIEGWIPILILGKMPSMDICLQLIKRLIFIHLNILKMN